MNTGNNKFDFLNDLKERAFEDDFKIKNDEEFYYLVGVTYYAYQWEIPTKTSIRCLLDAQTGVSFKRAIVSRTQHFKFEKSKNSKNLRKWAKAIKEYEPTSNKRANPELVQLGYVTSFDFNNKA